MYPAVILLYFISAAVILLASLVLTVQFSKFKWDKNGKDICHCGHKLNVNCYRESNSEYMYIKLQLNAHRNNVTLTPKYYQTFSLPNAKRSRNT